jgi:putative heme-binding domain-containing protein
MEIGAAGGGNVRRERARWLVQLAAPQAIEAVVTSLLRSSQQEDRLQALLLLRNIREGWTPAWRREYFAALNEMPRFVAGEGMPKFLAHLQEESKATLSESERAALADLLEAADDSSTGEPPPSRPVVKKWTLDDFPALAAAPLGGDPRRGESVFRDAQCARCHRVGARGPAVGPDLSFVGRRFSRRDILESILAPSQVVAEHYRSVQVITKDGRTILGRVLIEGDFRSERLRIAADPLRPAALIELNKRDVEEYRLSDVSPMPTGLLDGFQAGEIIDLLSYLETHATTPARP